MFKLFRGIEAIRNASRSIGATLRIPPALYPVLALLVLVAAAGGASKANSTGQLAIRIGAILLLGWCGLTSSTSPRRGARLPILFIALIATWIALQLVPLSGALRMLLPGQASFQAMYVAIGVSPPWHALNAVPDRGWNALMALLPPAAIAIALAGLNAKDRNRLLPPLLIVALASAVLGLLQAAAGASGSFDLYENSTPGTVNGLLANRNHNALLLAGSLPLLAVLAQRTRGRTGPRMALLSTGLFLLTTTIATGSRAGLIAVALACGATALIAGIGRRASRRQIVFVILISVVVAGTFLAAADRFSLFARLAATDLSSEARWRSLNPLLGLIRRFMPFGSGFGSFDPLYRSVEPTDALSPTYLNQAHDDYLQVALEGGLPAIILVLIFIAWWLRAGLRLWATRREDLSIARAGWSNIGLLLIASAFDYPLRTPLMMVLTVVHAMWVIDGLSLIDRGAVRFTPPDHAPMDENRPKFRGFAD